VRAEGLLVRRSSTRVVRPSRLRHLVATDSFLISGAVELHIAADPSGRPGRQPGPTLVIERTVRTLGSVASRRSKGLRRDSWAEHLGP
jgi:hypothetical protein